MDFQRQFTQLIPRKIDLEHAQDNESHRKIIALSTKTGEHSDLV
jgi:hypothetical protein